ncbi:hypothetical protein MS6015_46880 [Klebsiella pneumoniae]|nr:hypothetical protein MS6015_46880 [Klebsiella pneumoniae]
MLAVVTVSYRDSTTMNTKPLLWHRYISSTAALATTLARDKQANDGFPNQSGKGAGSITVSITGV